MADISAAMVKALREETGAGMMECKKALVETNGDSAAAAKLLKEKGLAAVAKRAERATSEGRIFVRQEGNKIAVVELCCETDFVANNADFIAAGEKTLDEVFAKNYTEVNKELSDILLDFATRTRENMSLSKVIVIDVPENATVGTYVHTDKKSGGIIVIKGSTSDCVKTFAKDCCLHLSFHKPSYITTDEVPADYIAEQKDLFSKQMMEDEKMKGKPQNVLDGILQGKINKHLAEICFMEQPFVKDDKKSVKAKLDEVAKEAGASLEFSTIQLLLLGK